MGKKFHLGDVLSITGEKLVSPRLMEGVYDILNYMTGENLFTHQLPRARDVCAPYLVKQFPQLAKAGCESINEKNWKECLTSLVRQFGETLEVEPLPKGAYTYIDPITEAENMVSDPSKVIVIKVNKASV